MDLVEIWGTYCPWQVYWILVVIQIFIIFSQNIFIEYMWWHRNPTSVMSDLSAKFNHCHDIFLFIYFFFWGGRGVSKIIKPADKQIGCKFKKKKKIASLPFSIMKNEYLQTYCGRKLLILQYIGL